MSTCNTWLLRALVILGAALAASNTGAVEAGVAAVDITPQVGVPLAGYGAKERRVPGYVDWGNKYPEATFFRPSEGIHSPIRAKSMVIRSGESQLVFVSLDLVGVEKRMVADLAERLAHLGIDEEQLVVGATHTHSGPGTLSRRWSMTLIAVDAFRRDNYEYLLDRTAESIELAVAQLESVELLRGEFETSGLQRNKWRRQDEDHYDQTARFLLARSHANGQLLGGVLNYALHGNGMPIGDLRFSSDVLGQIEIRMEELLESHNGNNHYPPVLLFLNGAEGDVGNPERSEEASEQAGVDFAAQAAESGFLDQLVAVEDDIQFGRTEVWLGWPGVSLSNCSGNRKYEPGADQSMDWRLPLPLMQKRTWVSAVRIGSILFLTWPGEPSAQVGYDSQAVASERGFDDTWILGLTNDYQSYFTTRDEYYEGVYDSCSSLFKWKGAERIHRAHGSLIDGFSAAD